MTTCGLYTRSTKKDRIGTSCFGQAEGRSFQNEETSWDCSSRESLMIKASLAKRLFGQRSNVKGRMSEHASPLTLNLRPSTRLPSAEHYTAAKGLGFFSSPIGVPAPWPQTTGVAGSSEKSFCRLDSRIWAVAPPQRSVLPMEPRKSGYPETSIGLSACRPQHVAI